MSQNSVPPNELLKLNSYLSATVTRVTSNSITIALENEIENQELDLNDDDEVYKLIKLTNDITYKRMKYALETILNQKYTTNITHLVDILFYQTQPTQIRFNDTIEFYNKNLDFSQKEAIYFAFKQKELAIIHGPPGTGKTTTLIEIIKQACLKYNQRILCLAPSNIAVDNLIERLIPFDYGRLKLVRLGHPARLLEHIQDYSLDSVLQKSEDYNLIDDIRNDMDKAVKGLKKTTNKGDKESYKRELRELRKELYKREVKSLKNVIENANCIFSTLNTGHVDNNALKHLKEGHFDLIIIDECSQSLEAACWIPLMFGCKKLILAGDHLQLPPTIISKEAAVAGLDKTLMKRLIDNYGEQCTKMICVQYRMNKLIMNWISSQLYESKLLAHESVAEHLLCDMPGVIKDENTQQAVVFIDTDGCDMDEMVSNNLDNASFKGDKYESKANEGEAKLVLLHVQQLLKAGLKQEQIAIISPYNLQVELVRTILHSKYPFIEVKSVDGFQGREKEAIILTLVRSNRVGEVGFLADERRINVAITRARRHLCVVCNSHTCKNNKFLNEFITYCELYGDKRSAFDYETLFEKNEFSELLNEFCKNRLKYAETTVKSNKSDVKDKGDVKEKSVKKPKKEKQKQVVTIDGNDNKSSKVQVASNVITVPTEEDIQFEIEVVKIIDSLNDTNKREHTFSSKLNARQRRIVHEMAEKYNIYHLSYGEDENRQIKISRFPLKEPIVKPVEAIGTFDVVSVTESLNDFKINKSIETQNENRYDALAKVESKNEDVVHRSTISSAIITTSETSSKKEVMKKCSNCLKEILIQNYQMHELNCIKMTQAKAAATTTSDESKKSKVKKNKLECVKSDDFDELINVCNELNNVCNYVGCKTKVQVLGQTCTYCRRRFCLTHSLAEVHGK